MITRLRVSFSVSTSCNLEQNPKAPSICNPKARTDMIPNSFKARRSNQTKQTQNDPSLHKEHGLDYEPGSLAGALQITTAIAHYYPDATKQEIGTLLHWQVLKIWLQRRVSLLGSAAKPCNITTEVRLPSSAFQHTLKPNNYHQKYSCRRRC